MPCFSLCECACDSRSDGFDRILQTETNFSVTLHEICHSNIGWYTDKTLSDAHFLSDFVRSTCVGVYLLWHKNDYCAIHNKFHMKALYVGKGDIMTRIATHWRNKDFSHQELVYFTYLIMDNRKAKYVEQLLLDLCQFPLNTSENRGAITLCAYWTQYEVD